MKKIIFSLVLAQLIFVFVPKAAVPTAVKAVLPTAVVIETPLVVDEPDVPLVYDGEAAKLIGEIYTKYGIAVSSPAAYEGTENLRWSETEIRLLAYELELLPDGYLTSNKSPQRVYLIKPKGTVGVPGGHYWDRNIRLFIPENFEYKKSIGDPLEHQLFGSQGEVLWATIAHEFTHAYTIDVNPSVLESWTVRTGWVWADNGWVNNGPGLINIRGQNVNPIEDIAQSVSVLQFNPSFLSEKRLRFFAGTEPYARWRPLVNYLRDYRPDLYRYYEKNKYLGPGE